jgi:ketosteroid isomerase-like protein
MSSPNTQPVKQFFNAFANGDIAGILCAFHDNVEIIAAGPSSVPWYGTYHGKAGVEAFLTALGGNVEPQKFEVHTLFGHEQTVVAAGALAHRVPATGKLFASDWALLCTIQDDTIIRYQFFEDTAAAAEAFQPAPSPSA